MTAIFVAVSVTVSGTLHSSIAFVRHAGMQPRVPSCLLNCNRESQAGRKPRELTLLGVEHLYHVGREREYIFGSDAVSDVMKDCKLITRYMLCSASLGISMTAVLRIISPVMPNGGTKCAESPKAGHLLLGCSGLHQCCGHMHPCVWPHLVGCPRVATHSLCVWPPRFRVWPQARACGHTNFSFGHTRLLR